jgi:hypothetical protein
MYGKATMADLWECVGEVVIAETHMAQQGAFGGVRCSHSQSNLSGYVRS